jgi:predicted esterase
MIAALFSVVALSLQSAPPPRTLIEPRVETSVTREAMAAAYLRVDTALRARLASGALAPEERRDFNRRFDSVTMLFFGGRFAEAIPTLNGLVLEMAGQDEMLSGALNQIYAVEPRLLITPREGERAPAISIHATPLGETSLVDPARTPLSLRTPSGELVPLGDWTEPVPWPAACSAPGLYELVLPTPGLGQVGLERGVPLSTITLMPEPASAVAARVGERLAALERDGVGSEGDRASLRSLLGLLRDELAPGKSASFLADRHALSVRAAMEAEAIANGRSPWIGFRGEAWRTIRAVAIDVPCRVLVPRSLPPAGEGNAKPPLLIALHGAGGDESMFLDGYGAGLLRELAERHGLVVVTPLTTAFAPTPVAFDAIVDEMKRIADIDSNRVFVLGHSMGAMATSRVAELRADRIAGIAMIAGGGEPQPRDHAPPPTLLVAGGLDPLFSAERMEQLAAGMRERYAKRGVSFASRTYPDDGHTFVVTAALPDVVAWLLSLPPLAPPAVTESATESATESKDAPRESPQRP